MSDVDENDIAEAMAAVAETMQDMGVTEIGGDTRARGLGDEFGACDAGS